MSIIQVPSDCAPNAEGWHNKQTNTSRTVWLIGYGQTLAGHSTVCCLGLFTRTSPTCVLSVSLSLSVYLRLSLAGAGFRPNPRKTTAKQPHELAKRSVFRSRFLTKLCVPHRTFLGFGIEVSSLRTPLPQFRSATHYFAGWACLWHWTHSLRHVAITGVVA